MQLGQHPTGFPQLPQHCVHLAIWPAEVGPRTALARRRQPVALRPRLTASPWEAALAECGTELVC